MRYRLRLARARKQERTNKKRAGGSFEIYWLRSLRRMTAANSIFLPSSGREGLQNR